MKPVSIGVVSDSHGRFKRLKKMADEAPAVSAWIHGGDYSSDADDLATYTGVPAYAVLGNNDYFRESTAPECRKVTLAGVTIVVIHGCQWYGEKRLEKLVELGQENKASLVIFGHTHRCFLKNIDGITILNPGSIGLPRDCRHGTYGIVTIDQKKIQDIRMYELSD
ncbi:MAG: metallophosphoesterase [Megasphaera sp.]|jgi:putative phosphoesterase|nr:metallophosphoesterase [Megasphaera sp.]MCI1247476.1 metallophosphoesterase [Megasphaera sp.]